MFIETHIDREKNLAFIKSSDVQAYPCGRRRSDTIDTDGDRLTTADSYRIPFDPEARLNTEANARKHSSINGYAQTYIKQFNNNLFELSLGGYLFSIKLSAEYASPEYFCTKLLDFFATNNVEVANATEIFANILIEDVHLYSGFQEYYTGVLRNQSNSVGDGPKSFLDLLPDGAAEKEDANNYYFSGLSFSLVPLVDELTSSEEPYSIKPVSVTRTNNITANQTCISLRLFKKVNNSWILNNRALLPKVEHGSDDNSVLVNKLDVAHVAADSIDTENLRATTINATNVGTVEDKITNVVAETIYSDGLSVGDNVTAPEFYISQANTSYRVPFMSITKQADGSYQLQINRVN